MSAKNFEFAYKAGGKRYKPKNSASSAPAVHSHLMTASETRPSSHEANPAPGASTALISKTGFYYTAKSGKNKGKRMWRELGGSYGKRKKRMRKAI